MGITARAAPLRHPVEGAAPVLRRDQGNGVVAGSCVPGESSPRAYGISIRAYGISIRACGISIRACGISIRACGVSIREAIEAGRGQTVSTGSLYTAIRRLEDRGYVRTVVGEPTAKRGGPAKKCVRLKPEGHRALEEVAEACRWVVEGAARERRAT